MKPLNIVNILFSACAGSMLVWAFIIAHDNGFKPPRTQQIAVARFPFHLLLDPDTLSAKAAVVYDPKTKTVLFAKNADTTLPLASLTKLMTAQTTLTLQDEKKIISITKKDLTPEGDWGLTPGESWSIHQLLRFGLVASSNDAMAAVAAASGPHFIDSMNATAKDLGLTQSYFSNPTGLDVDPETAGAYGSAKDIALLAAAFLKTNPELFEQTNSPSVSIQNNRALLTATSTDTPLLTIPGLVAAKTGYTDLAGGNLVAVFDVEVGHPVVIAVLGSTKEGRFEDMHTLIEAMRNEIP